MQLFHNKQLLRVLAMVMVLVMTLCCFAGCGNDSGNNEGGPNGGGNGNGNINNSNTVTYEWNGLHYTLSKDFKDTGIGGDQYGSYSNDTLVLTVAADTTPEGVTNSKSFANYYKDQMSSVGSVSISSSNGISYAVVDYGDGTKEARAFYVDGDQCWVMYVTSYDYDQYSNEIISIITCGAIGNPPDTGNNTGNNSNNSGNNSTPDNDNNGNSGNSSNITNPDPGNLTQYSHDGLTYYVGKDFDVTESSSHMKHTCGTTIIWVTGGATPSNITDAKSFADFYVTQAQSAGYTATRRYQNGVYYTVTELDAGITEARAFYYYNNYGWCIYATSDHYTSESAALVQYITSGIIDKDYDHSSGNSGNGSINNTSPDPDLPHSPVNPKPEKPDSPSTDPSVTNGTKYSFDGLTYQPGTDFNAVNMGDYMMHTNGSTTIVVMGGIEQNSSSVELAMQYCTKMKENRFASQIEEKNNIHYVITDLRDGTMEIRGFYTDGVHYWNIYATTYNFAREESILISYITSGVID